MSVHVLLGGTGTLGHALTERLLRVTGDRIRILARGEHRLSHMRKHFNSDRLSFLVGDVRDEQRLQRALAGSTHVYLMAALKHVHTCEYDVLEAVKTNVNGAVNVVGACMAAGVQKAVLVSSDKAVEPTTAYGATKMVAERIFIHARSYVGSDTEPVFYCVRYGNVIGSQGSVVELWRHQASEGVPLTVADPEATRFWWTADDAAEFVHRSVNHARSGDILVPLMHSCSLAELADLVAPGSRRVRVDGYATEKVHEVLLAPHECIRATYVTGWDAIRISSGLHPTDERPWRGSQLCSTDHTSVAGVRERLSSV